MKTLPYGGLFLSQPRSTLRRKMETSFFAAVVGFFFCFFVFVLLMAVYDDAIEMCIKRLTALCEQQFVIFAKLAQTCN
jgi:hypothetical protein